MDTPTIISLVGSSIAFVSAIAALFVATYKTGRKVGELEKTIQDVPTHTGQITETVNRLGLLEKSLEIVRKSAEAYNELSNSHNITRESVQILQTRNNEFQVNMNENRKDLKTAEKEIQVKIDSVSVDLRNKINEVRDITQSCEVKLAEHDAKLKSR